MGNKPRDVAQLLLLLELRRLTNQTLLDLQSRNPELAEAVGSLNAAWSRNFSQIEALVAAAQPDQAEKLQ